MHRDNASKPVSGLAETRTQEPASSYHDVLLEIRREFDDLPSVPLTLHQAKRLFCLTQVECERLFAQLEAEGFIRQTDWGAYVRSRIH